MWEQLLGLFNVSPPEQQKKIESLFNLVHPMLPPVSPAAPSTTPPASPAAPSQPSVSQPTESSSTVPPQQKENRTIFHGQHAITKALEYYPNLTKGQMELIAWEGFSTKPYKDTKGYLTNGVGQTGEYLNTPFTDVYQTFEDKLRKAIPKYDTFSPDLKSALVVGKYRGDLGDQTINLLNRGKFKEASREFLDHKEYQRMLKNRNYRLQNQQVFNRMNFVANTIAKGK